MEPITLPIEDVLDLHTFRPADLPKLIDDYLEACRQKEFKSVRIIHGKGKGILRDRLHSLLRRHAAVVSFRLAPPEAGGWGATVVTLAPQGKPAGDSGLKSKVAGDRSQNQEND